MKQLRIDLADRSYDILIGQGLLQNFQDHLPVSSSRALVVTNPEIKKLYGKPVLAGLAQKNIEADLFEIPEGETHKNLQSAESVYNHLMENNFDRSTLMVALGGGVIGDLTGFVAATYQRGVPYMQVPTTLLSQVDSSVGGKTAVNHPRGKNMIGAFYQPRVVVIDIDTLQSLPPDEFRAGLAEIIKYGVIEDPGLFDYLETNSEKVLSHDTESLEHIIETSCAIKARVVEKDETESRYRMVLNYGHTLGHAIEALTHYKQFKHGEAVAIGMVYAARLSHQLGKCSKDVPQRIHALIEKYGFATALPEFSADDYIGAMLLDKKSHDKKIRFILTTGIGSVEIVDEVTESDLKTMLSA